MKLKRLSTVFLVFLFSLLCAITSFAGGGAGGGWTGGSNHNSGNKSANPYPNRWHYGFRFTVVDSESVLYEENGTKGTLKATAAVLDGAANGGTSFYAIPSFPDGAQFEVYDYSSNQWTTKTNEMSTIIAIQNSLNSYTLQGKTISWSNGSSYVENSGGNASYDELFKKLFARRSYDGNNVGSDIDGGLITDWFNVIFRGGQSYLWGSDAPLRVEGDAPKETIIGDPSDVFAQIGSYFGGEEKIVVIEPVSVVQYANNTVRGFTHQQVVCSVLQSSPSTGAPFGVLSATHNNNVGGPALENASALGHMTHTWNSLAGSTENKIGYDGNFNPSSSNREGRTIFGLGNVGQTWVWKIDSSAGVGTGSADTYAGGNEIPTDVVKFSRNAGYVFYKLGQGGGGDPSESYMNKYVKAKKEQSLNGTGEFTTSEITVEPSNTIKYKITIDNTGDKDLNHVKVTDKVPIPADILTVGSLTYSSGAYPSASLVDGYLTWDVGTIPKKSSKEFTFTVTVPSSISQSCKWQNTATIEADDIITVSVDSSGSPGGSPGGDPGGSPGGGPGGDPGGSPGGGGTPTETVRPNTKVTTNIVVAKYDGVPEPTGVSGIVDFVLKDYELNHVYPSLFAGMNGGSQGFLKTKKGQYTYYKKTGTHAHYHYPHDEYTDQNFYVKYTELDVSSSASTGGNGWLTEDRNTSKVFLKTTWLDRHTESTITVKTDTDQKTIDYAFNQMRYMYKGLANKADIRVFSSFYSQPFDDSFLGTNGTDGVLHLKKGDKTSTSDIAEPDGARRSSTAWLKTLTTDKVKWNAVYNIGGGTTHYEQVDCPGGYDNCTNSSCSRHGSHHHHGSWTTHKTSHKIDGNLDAFEIAGSIHDQDTGIGYYQLTIFTAAQKYRTDKTVPDGDPSNDPVKGTPNQTVLDFVPTKDSNGGGMNEYEIAVSKKFDSRVLKYYPEVPMLATFVDSTSAGKTDVVYTIGEEPRQTVPGGIMYMVLKSSGDPIKGTIYSDTSVGGDTQKNNTKNSLTAGGDFTIKADMSGMTLNLYGYTMDIIDDSDTSLVSSVLNGHTGLKTSWGDDSISTITTQMQAWAGQFLNPNNYSADFRMKAGGKTSTNFSAVVGGFDKTASDLTYTDDVYQVTVKNGNVIYSDELLNQMLADYPYDNNTDNILNLLRDAGWDDAILNSIEHTGASYNNAQTAANLGSVHWYDEVVRTICIRRYKCEGIHMQGIIAQDKLDLTTVQQDWGTSSNGTVDVTVWFGDSAGSLPTIDGFEASSMTVFGNDSAMKDTFRNNGDIIFDNVNVKGADFSITYSTTNTRQ